MSTNTQIEWTRSDDGKPGKTWNPIVGCERVSPGCDRCYAITTAHIRASHPNEKVSSVFAGTTRKTPGGIDWSGRISLIPERLAEPLRWREPRRVFVNSVSDLFHADVPDSFIAQIYAVMAQTPQHTYQILTKRHGRMRSLLGGDKDGGQALIEAAPDDETAGILYDAFWPLPNVWLGVSAEDQKHADLRVPSLLGTAASVRFISCEPLIGPVDLTQYLDRVEYKGSEQRQDIGHVDWYGPRIGWVIAGGESGPGARPVNLDWVRTLRDQCTYSGVPFFFKQVGGRSPKSGGRTLDGRTWDEFPRTDNQ